MHPLAQDANFRLIVVHFRVELKHLIQAIVDAGRDDTLPFHEIRNNSILILHCIDTTLLVGQFVNVRERVRRHGIIIQVQILVATTSNGMAIVANLVVNGSTSRYRGKTNYDLL